MLEEWLIPDKSLALKPLALYRECAGDVKVGSKAMLDRRRIADTTTCTKPPYFGRTIAFKRGLVFRVLGGLAHLAVAERTVALRKDVTAESPALQSS
jgi:hypothetical protein